LALGGQRQRAVLALLLLRANPRRLDRVHHRRALGDAAENRVDVAPELDLGAPQVIGAELLS
jgi:hypothetical protein